MLSVKRTFQSRSYNVATGLYTLLYLFMNIPITPQKYKNFSYFFAQIQALLNMN